MLCFTSHIVITLPRVIYLQILLSIIKTTIVKVIFIASSTIFGFRVVINRNIPIVFIISFCLLLLFSLLVLVIIIISQSQIKQEIIIITIFIILIVIRRIRGLRSSSLQQLRHPITQPNTRSLLHTLTNILLVLLLIIHNHHGFTTPPTSTNTLAGNRLLALPSLPHPASHSHPHLRLLFDTGPSSLDLDEFLHCQRRFMGRRPFVMPFNLLKMRPRDWIGIIDAQSGQVVVRHVFGRAARSHGTGIFEHWLVRFGEGGGGDLEDFAVGQFIFRCWQCGYSRVFVVFHDIVAKVAGAGWGVNV
mmetsp:Transcript_3957/g.8924  ORF Transcript_3957/g.8924 Transcript_3957/m.8924 type:complete len:303 (-) Transcript_3957:218-1126(-)